MPSVGTTQGQRVALDGGREVGIGIGSRSRFPTARRFRFPEIPLPGARDSRPPDARPPDPRLGGPWLDARLLRAQGRARSMRGTPGRDGHAHSSRPSGHLADFAIALPRAVNVKEKGNTGIGILPTKSYTIRARLPLRKAVGWPREVTLPGLPQIRTCTINASGSSTVGVVANRRFVPPARRRRGFATSWCPTGARFGGMGADNASSRA